MGIILCATRGGDPSSQTEQVAIELAKERGDILLWLYVVDLSFLDKTAAPIVVDVEDELTDLGEFLLLMAKERAKQEGVETKTIVRKGKVRKEIKRAAIQEGATLVVLGRPAGEGSTFEMESLQKFAEEIEKETGAKTLIV